MTTDPDGHQVPPEGGFREGIYLEQKKSTIGTGSTAKTTEYRTFWATGRVMADSAVMILLDDGFKPTAIKETFPLETLTGPNWFFIAEGEKKYHHIRPLLDHLLEAPPVAVAKPANPPAKAEAAKWWEGGSSSGPPANPFDLSKDKKQTPAPAKKGGWWEK
ncbi:MAG: hypothetical protein LBC90_07475 [Candidatus Adiutrix sp.]|jgi:hypothetical protein|nr:hypothetical protein [Candidatus Adiutrix sp.]